MQTRTLAGIFLLTASTLLFEINLASQFVISTGHHFASVVVSTALLGIGAAGVFVHLFPSFALKFSPASISFALGLAYPTVMAAAGQVAFDPVRLDWDAREIFHLFLYYPLFALPFFFSALVVTGVMKKKFRHSGKIYFADMAGAAIGSLLFFLVSRVAGLPIAVCSLFAAAAVLVFDGGLATRKRLPMVALIAVTAAILYPRFELPISPYKELALLHNYPRTEVMESSRGPAGRIDVISSPFIRWAPGLDPLYGEPVPGGTAVVLNGDVYSVITKSSADYLLHLPASLPYHFAEPENALIIGAAGGYEARIARMIGGKRVTVVEEKKEIVRAIKNVYDPPYHFSAEPARTHLASFENAGEFDLISIAQPTAARGLGSGVLSENYIHTREFFALCASRLARDGILTATVRLVPPPRGEIRLLKMMAEIGPTGWNNVAAFRSWGTFTVIFKKDGFSADELTRLKRLADELSLDYVYFPGIDAKETNRINQMSRPIYYQTVIRLISGGETIFNTAAATDDSPFFGNYLRLSQLKKTLNLLEGRWLPILTGGGMDVLVIAQAFTVSFALLLLPMILINGKEGGSQSGWLIYFFMLGAGYMLAELVFIQKGILALGSPVTAAAIVIPTFIGSSALGGLVSARFSFGFRPPATVAILLLVSAFMMGGYLDPTSGYSGKAQYAFFLITIATTGFFMGMPYPLGLKSAGDAPGNMVAYGMAANGFASVIGAASAPFFALLFGFSRVFLLAAVLYVTASLFASRLAVVKGNK